MTPFLSLGYEIVKEAEKEAMYEFALTHPKEIEMLKSSISGEEYGLARVWSWNKIMLPLIARLKVKCTVPHEVGMYFVPPNTELRRHVDWRTVARQCTIITPLKPVKYQPTLFFEADSEEPCMQMNLEDLPALMDTQVHHAVKASPEPRVQFQLYFGQPFAQIAELIRAGKLFRPGKVA